MNSCRGVLLQQNQHAHLSHEASKSNESSSKGSNLLFGNHWVGGDRHVLGWVGPLWGVWDWHGRGSGIVFQRAFHVEPIRAHHPDNSFRVWSSAVGKGV